jgi:hypothetical protein
MDGTRTSTPFYGHPRATGRKHSSCPPDWSCIASGSMACPGLIHTTKAGFQTNGGPSCQVVWSAGIPAIGNVTREGAPLRSADKHRNDLRGTGVPARREKERTRVSRRRTVKGAPRTARTDGAVRVGRLKHLLFLLNNRAYAAAMILPSWGEAMATPDVDWSPRITVRLCDRAPFPRASGATGGSRRGCADLKGARSSGAQYADPPTTAPSSLGPRVRYRQSPPAGAHQHAASKLEEDPAQKSPSRESDTGCGSRS